ncbi:hypothetical protein BDZ89DRAFT_826876 [Hymenopellis radicata]|nr:hypothetical protein BDZ89DRAFT_826876 [Hymenopellis radicata]
MSNDNEKLKLHPQFAYETADLCIRSSDNVIFKIHQKNIDTHTTVFPPFPSSKDDVVELSERAEVLQVLFKYIYPTPPLPDLGDIAFPLLEEISIAADKYQFTSLSVICDVHMGVLATTKTTPVLRYALLRRNMGIAKLCDKHIESNAKIDPAEALRYAILERQDEDMADRIGVYTIGIPIGTAANLFTGDLFRRWVTS